MAADTPADLARKALLRIAELRLPPTPENFARFYTQASGAVSVSVVPPSPSPSETGIDLSTLQQVDTLVGRAVETTTSLTTGLVRHDLELNASLDALAGVSAGNAAVELLLSVIALSQEIRSTVKVSQDELVETRRSLAEIKSQLRESQKMLVQDPLTGTENRRAMDSILTAAVTRCRRENDPLSVVMVDIDHFKNINDTYGHAAGDAALVHLTALARSMLRGNDGFIRYGGEEFLMVLPETALQGGVSTGTRLQNLLKRQPLVYEDRVIAMTFSGGVSELLPTDSDEALIRRADAALYEAKRAGRNLVVAAK